MGNKGIDTLAGKSEDVYTMMDYKTIIDGLRSEYANEIAFMEVDDEGNVCSYSYEMFIKDIRKVATYFMQNRINEKVVAIVGNNSYYWLVCAYACLYTDTTVFPIDSYMDKSAVFELCKTTEVGVVLADETFVVNEKCEMQGINILSMKDCFDSEDHMDEYDIRVDESKVICYMCSSGTTGKSKIVMFSYRNLVAPIKRGWPRGTNTNGDNIRIMWTMPFFHVGLFSLISIFMDGDTLCVEKSPKYYFRDMKLFEPHYIPMVPMLYDAIVKKVERGQSIREILGNNCSCICCGAAPLRKEYIKLLYDEGIRIEHTYGMTETSGLGTENIISPQSVYKIGSVGKINQYIEIALKDGEIIMRGDGVMLGYYGDEKATEETVKDGWLYTGDMGYIDEDGFLYIKGRKKNLIITSSGENVLPEEIEEFFLQKKIVEEISVYNENDVITAEFYIGSRKVDEAVIRDAVREYNNETSAAKNIRSIKFRNTRFEKTATGKIVRKS